MMYRMSFNNISKSYGNKLLFDKIEGQWTQPGIYGICGPNGSGKSTILKIFALLERPDHGEVHHLVGDSLIPSAEVYRHLSYQSPDLMLPESLSASELYTFHSQFKPMTVGLEEWLQNTSLSSIRQTRFGQMSSGQQQRLRLGLLFYSASPLWLLDEPGTYLDDENFHWMIQQMRQHHDKKLIIIATNDARERQLAETVLDLVDDQFRT